MEINDGGSQREEFELGGIVDDSQSECGNIDPDGNQIR